MRAAVWLWVLVAALVVAACGGATSTATPVPTEEPSAQAPASVEASDASAEPSSVIVPDSPVAGIVVSVDSGGLNDVRGFTLRSSSGETLTFVLGTLENGDEFPPGHLAEHQAAASPVLVFFREENGKLVVFRIEDAG